MSWKKFVSDYLSFSKRDRFAVIILLVFILAIFFLPKAISSSGKKASSPQDTAWAASLKNLEEPEKAKNDQSNDQNEGGYNHDDLQYDRTKSDYSDKPHAELFYFDPNTLLAEDWKRLGLKEKTIHTIQNYLGKGGHFNKPEDLQKVYGLHKDEYERLAPYIRIVPTEKINNKGEFTHSTPDPSSGKTAFSIQVIDINMADTSAFIALPGIGSKLAARIINFRDKLGGFYSINQVGETYGLPDSTFQKIKPFLKLENILVKKININTATTDELKAHPYIRYSLANPIVVYRNEHGPFTKLEDLKKVMAITEDVYNKLKPYVTVDY